jgi:hypothetical protein
MPRHSLYTFIASVKFCVAAEKFNHHSIASVIVIKVRCYIHRLKQINRKLLVYLQWHGAPVH